MIPEAATAVQREPPPAHVWGNVNAGGVRLL